MTSHFSHTFFVDEIQYIIHIIIIILLYGKKFNHNSPAWWNPCGRANDNCCLGGRWSVAAGFGPPLLGILRWSRKSMFSSFSLPADQHDFWIKRKRIICARVHALLLVMMHRGAVNSGRGGRSAKGNWPADTAPEGKVGWGAHGCHIVSLTHIFTCFPKDTSPPQTRVIYVNRIYRVWRQSSKSLVHTHARLHTHALHNTYIRTDIYYTIKVYILQPALYTHRYINKLRRGRKKRLWFRTRWFFFPPDPEQRKWRQQISRLFRCTQGGRFKNESTFNVYNMHFSSAPLAHIFHSAWANTSSIFRKLMKYVVMFFRPLILSHMTLWL